MLEATVCEAAAPIIRPAKHTPESDRFRFAGSVSGELSLSLS